MYSKLNLSKKGNGMSQGLWNRTSTGECQSCSEVNLDLLMECIREAKFDTIWPIQGGWPCLASGTLNHAMQPMCCCGKRREDNLAMLFTTGFGYVRPKPNEDVVSITFELGVALTCLLTLAGEEIRDRLYEQRAPNCLLA